MGAAAGLLAKETGRMVRAGAACQRPVSLAHEGALLRGEVGGEVNALGSLTLLLA